MLQPIQAKLRTGSSEDQHTRAADHIMPADSAMVQRDYEEGFDVSRAVETQLMAQRDAGHPLPAHTQAFMESRFDADFGDVRVHTGAEAGEISGQLQAKAFTHGQDIYFGAGEYAPETDAGKHLLAHELTHTLQQTGAQRVAGAPPTAGVLQAKMKGSHDALTAVGTDGRNWNKIRDLLRTYEGLEEAQVARLQTFKRLQEQDKVMKHLSKEHAKTLGGRELERKRDIQNKFSQMRSTLQKLKDMITTWLGRTKHVKSTQEYTHQRSDALRILLPRLNLEISDIDSGQFEKSTLSGNLEVVRFEAVGGQLNKLDEVKSGGAVGYFQEERPKLTNKDKEGPASGLGIPEMDPRLGARSVAMYRIDQLLGLNVLAKTEYAVSGRQTGGAGGPIVAKMGFFMQKATGQEAARAASGGAVNADDAVLQRSLVKLQMLDVICGQVDRHMGNYFINIQAGRVVGIQGIDNDMSFGVSHTELGEAPSGIHYRGIPPVVDTETAERILALKSGDLALALGSLLTPSEVANTVARLEKFQVELRRMKAANLFTDQWGSPEATRALRKGPENYFSIVAETSEGAQIRNALIAGGYRERIIDQCRQQFEGIQRDVADVGGPENYEREYGTRPKSLEEIINDKLNGEGMGVWKQYVNTGKLTMAQALDIARRAGTELAGGENLFTFIDRTIA